MEELLGPRLVSRFKSLYLLNSSIWWIVGFAHTRLPETAAAEAAVSITSSNLYVCLLLQPPGMDLFMLAATIDPATAVRSLGGSANERVVDRLSGLVQVFKHKPKKHYQRKTGHRQPLTKFLVTKISPGS